MWLKTERRFTLPIPNLFRFPVFTSRTALILPDTILLLICCLRKIQSAALLFQSICRRLRALAAIRTFRIAAPQIDPLVTAGAADRVILKKQNQPASAGLTKATRIHSGFQPLFYKFSLFFVILRFLLHLFSGWAGLAALYYILCSPGLAHINSLCGWNLLKN